MTPGIGKAARARPRGSVNNAQVGIQNPVSTVGHEDWLVFCFTQAAGPGQPASADGSIDGPWVAAAPKGAISMGSGKRPSTGTYLDSSAITIMRAEAVATIFSRSKRSAAAFDKGQVR